MMRKEAIVAAVVVAAVVLWQAASPQGLRRQAMAQAAPAPSRPAGDPRLAGDPSNPRVTPVVRAYNKARPAVVNIASEAVVTAGIGPFGVADPFEDIFPFPSPFLRRVPVQSIGSGFVVNAAGYVATNAHVVRRAQKITVTLADGATAAAKVIAADSAHDLAVLKIDPPRDKSGAAVPLACLTLGRSDDLMVGETVIAIGNPLGYANSVTTGVISAVGRELEFPNNIKYEGLIQTDAPINPGNSGGPLLNVNGELIGMTTAIRSDAQNIGFAIPADAIAQQMLKLLDYERINRVIVGMSVELRHGQKGDEVVVSEVRSGTPAAGNLVKGDRVIAVNGQAMRQGPDFACMMLGVKADAGVKLEVVRGGKAVSVSLTPAAKPRPDGKSLAEQLFGMTLVGLTQESARDAHLAVDRGLAVVAVEPESPAAKIGLKAKDVIFQFNQLYVGELDDLGMLLEDVQRGDSIRIGVVRGNRAAWVVIQARQKRPPASAPASGEAKSGTAAERPSVAAHAKRP